MRLGKREWDTKHLKQAAMVYREALKERPRERVPLLWAATQNNLCAALGELGTRDSDTERLKEAIGVCRAALEEGTRDQVPLEWAKIQSNLGKILAEIGNRETGTRHLNEVPDEEDDDGYDADSQGRHDDGHGQDANRQGRDGASNTPSSHDPSGTGEVMDANARAGDSSDSGEAPVDIAAEEQAWDEACSTFTRVAADMVAKPPKAARCTGVLQSKSLPPSTAPIATGWSDTCRAGFAPAG